MRSLILFFEDLCLFFEYSIALHSPKVITGLEYNTRDE
jgi:hypothetical protein